MDFKKLNETLLMALGETAERYLKAIEEGPHKPHPDGSFAKSPGFTISLIENGKFVTSNLNGLQFVGISLLNGPKFEDIPDQKIRNIAKDYFENITDDIRVERG